MNTHSLTLGFQLTVTAAVAEQHMTEQAPPFAAQGTLANLRRELPGQSWNVWTVGTDDNNPVSAIVVDEHNGQAVLLCGEIYNRSELQTALDEPSPGNDAALVLKCFLRYGAHAFRLINGRFAAVIASGSTTFVATDHAGSIPLFVQRHPRALTISTEKKTIAAADRLRMSGPTSSDLNGPTSSQVPAGTVVAQSVNNGEAPRSFRTWTPPLHRHAPPEDEAVVLVRSALSQAIDRRLRDTDGLPTTILSGGIDSSTVTALAAAASGGVRTVSMGTVEHNEFAAARDVTDHVGRAFPDSDHTELIVDTEEVLAELPWAVWATEIHDATVIEYLLPLAVLYRRLPGPPRRILTGYGADIPLGGMHRDVHDLSRVEDVIVHDMATFDGLNELSPTLASIAGHWTTHPFWDRDVLDLLVALEPGLKRRYTRDKWVLRQAMPDLLPPSTVARPKIGVHEGSGISASFAALLESRDVRPEDVPRAKQCVVRAVYDEVIGLGRHPAHVELSNVLDCQPWLSASKPATS